MPKETKGKQEKRKQDKRSKSVKRKTRPTKTRFFFGRDLSAEEILNGIKQMCRSAGIRFIEEREK